MGRISGTRARRFQAVWFVVVERRSGENRGLER